MNSFKYVFFAIVLSVVMVSTASAGVVEVFVPADPETSVMALRNKAMTEGFAEALLQESSLVLPGVMSEERGALFKEYMVTRYKSYIQGYKVVSMHSGEEGVNLTLDVRVNRNLLRTALHEMGMFVTSTEPLSASVTWPESFSEEQVSSIQGFMTLTGIRNTPEIFPSFYYEPGPEGTFKGRFETEDKEWTAVSKDISVVWFTLWDRYFKQLADKSVAKDKEVLTVNGWFSSDAALEFDAMLRGWENAVQEVELVELDMLPSGVGGTWTLRYIDAQRLRMLLQSYLPQRGLTYQLAGDAAKE